MRSLGDSLLHFCQAGFLLFIHHIQLGKSSLEFPYRDLMFCVILEQSWSSKSLSQYFVPSPRTRRVEGCGKNATRHLNTIRNQRILQMKGIEAQETHLC